MNILFLSHVSSLYGANRSMLDIIRNINREKFKCFVVIPNRGEIGIKLREMKVSYKVVPMSSTVHTRCDYEELEKIEKNCKAIKEICNLIHMWNIDIVHTNSSVINLGAIAAKITKRKHIWHIRELDIHYNYKRDSKLLDRILLKKSDKVICISNYVKKELCKKTNYENIVVFYNPIDSENYNIKREAVLAHTQLKLLVCGLIHENKKQLVAVRAMKILVDKGYRNLKLIIVGDGGGYKKKIVQYIRTNHMGNYVEINPFCEDLSKYREQADIAIMSSVYEALGRVTIESMLSELIVIGADSGATHELIKNGVNGLKYMPDSPEELAEKIEYAIGHKEEMEKIVKQAKRFAIKCFEAKEKVPQLEAIYLQLFNE